MQIDPNILELNQLIIGTVSEMDNPKTKNETGYSKTLQYITGVSDKMIQRTRDEILNLRQEDIKNLAKIFDDVIKQNNISVIGTKESIEKDKDLFDEIIRI